MFTGLPSREAEIRETKILRDKRAEAMPTEGT